METKGTIFCLRSYGNNRSQDKCAINDPLGQTHIHANNDHYSSLNFVLFCESLKIGDGRTDRRIDNTCENSDHYRPWLWVGLVNQKQDRAQ